MTRLETLDKMIEVHQKKINNLHAIIGKKYFHIILFLASVAVIWMLLGRVDLGKIFGVIISIPIPALVIYEIIISIYDSRNTISKHEHDQIKAIRKEIKGFEQKMLCIYEAFPSRTKGARFKNFHELKSTNTDFLDLSHDILIVDKNIVCQKCRCNNLLVYVIVRFWSLLHISPLVQRLALPQFL